MGHRLPPLSWPTSVTGPVEATALAIGAVTSRGVASERGGAATPPTRPPPATLARGGPGRPGEAGEAGEHRSLTNGGSLVWVGWLSTRLRGRGPGSSRPPWRCLGSTRSHPFQTEHPLNHPRRSVRSWILPQATPHSPSVVRSIDGGAERARRDGFSRCLATTTTTLTLTLPMTETTDHLTPAEG
jgi:hypothetical protein